jgi:RNAse (barnase) inhibitor barstar
MTQQAGQGQVANQADAVRRLPLPDATVAGIEAIAQAVGLRVHVVDLTGCETKADLLERAAAALAFPAWFGHNWDAWFDCLTDFSWLPAASGHVVLLRHAYGLRQAAPEALDTALAIVEDAAHVWAGRGTQFVAFVDTEA